MRQHVVLGCAVMMLLVATASWPAPTELASPPLRYADDTRSAFAWAPQEAGFPQAATVRVRVVEQYRPEPNAWEVAWVVLGTDQWFVAFVPKAGGWHVELVDTRVEPYQRYVASGSSPSYPVCQPITVSMAARESGIEITADSFRTREGRQEPVRLALFISWTEGRQAPGWWGEAMRAGIYVEDCAAELEWVEPE